MSLIQNTKQDYYCNLDHRQVADINHLGSIKPLYYYENSVFNQITLMEKDSIPKKNYDIAEIFNEYFSFFTIILSKLNILRYQDPVIDTDQTEN